eukprot:TRINITY_DN44791_c0_g1_i1.p1 TRINITY_DN44791_c0_g1~~TRINITY_DN44791_c0_g1_i1.p1  ORF type:complete len:149 (-),score=26.68 TRINITY_DN44791_c0_g1_i1:256-702(-)
MGRVALFVCTGNTCRSQLAHGIANHVLATQAIPDWECESAGVSAVPGDPVNPKAMVTLRSSGIEHSGSAKLLTAELATKATVIFCMTQKHLDAVLKFIPESSASKAQLIDPAGDIDDPINQSQSVYNEVGERLLALIPKRLAKYDQEQ